MLRWMFGATWKYSIMKDYICRVVDISSRDETIEAVWACVEKTIGACTWMSDGDGTIRKRGLMDGCCEQTPEMRDYQGR